MTAEKTSAAAAVARNDRPKPTGSRPGRRFQPGNPGKPKGTKTKATLVGIEICRAMAGRAADRLAALVDSRSHRIAFEASRLVLAYAWGAPRQTLEMVGDFGDLSRELAAALVEARLKRNGGAPIVTHVVNAGTSAQLPTMPTYPTSEPVPLLLKEPGAESLQEASGSPIAADDVEAGHENASATGAHDAAAPGAVASSSRAPDPEGFFS